MNEPIGLLGSFIPDLALIIASDTNSIAESCPLTLFFRLSFKLSSFSFSPLTNFATGIFVQRDTISAMLFSSTTSDKILFCIFNFNWDISDSILGISPCLILAASVKS